MHIPRFTLEHRALPFVVLLLVGGVLACESDDEDPDEHDRRDGSVEADGGSKADGSSETDGGRDADGGPQADSGARDSGPVDGGRDAGPPKPECPDGMIVDSQTGCLQDDAFCRELSDGRYCTGPMRPSCPEGSTAIARDEECPPYTVCWDYSPGLRCARRAYTPEQCAAVGGVAIPDPGDGSVVNGGCPDGASSLGPIDAGWIEGGLCCSATRVPCGARAGATCSDEQYCAYEEGELCGQADAEATCQMRPDACDAVLSPVCGCDGKTYSNACEANAAGSGVFSRGDC